MFKLYSLYSPSKDRFYIGMTGDLIEERIRKHNSNHQGFTGKTGDWSLVHLERYYLKADAAKREKEIKNWKSKRMIKKLIKA